MSNFSIKLIGNTVFVLFVLTTCRSGFATDVETDWQKTDWTPIFQGIDHATGQTDSPRLMSVQALRIDLKAKGVRFFSTPRAEEGFDFNVKETIRETVPQFLERNHLQAAFNANFYAPFSAITTRTHGPSNVSGLAISQGQLVSPHQKNMPAFLVFKDNRAEISAIPEDNTEPPANVETAVAGNCIILEKGVVLPQTNQAVHPRTAVGIAKDGRYVYFIVVDGRQPKHSVGATYQDTAQWLLLFGAWNGLNLDGGGSATMAVSTEDGKAKVLNTPIGQGVPNTYRYNGNGIGVYAPVLAP